MQTAPTLRRSSINSIAATLAVFLALTAGGAGGYWLKSQVAATATMVTPQPAATAVTQRLAPPHDMPEEGPYGPIQSRTGD